MDGNQWRSSLHECVHTSKHSLAPSAAYMTAIGYERTISGDPHVVLSLQLSPIISLRSGQTTPSISAMVSQPFSARLQPEAFSMVLAYHQL